MDIQGVRFHYGTSNHYIDVTEIMQQQLHSNNNMITMGDGSYDSFFQNTDSADISPNLMEHLKIDFPNEKQPIYIRKDTPFTLNMNHVKHYTIPSIHIVYFINTYISPFYKSLLEAQITDLASTGLLQYATLYIESCGSNVQDIADIVHPIAPHARITCHNISNWS